MPFNKRYVDLVRFYEFDLHDLSVAFRRKAVNLYGPDPFRGKRIGRFGKRGPVTFNSVKVGHKQQDRGVMNFVEIEPIRGHFIVGGPEGEPMLRARVENSFRTEVEQFFDCVQAQLDTASIYRGNAVTAMREFLDLSGISMDRLVYNSKVMRDLQANIWTLIEQPEQCLSANIKLHRRILFSGMFGSGKTLAALVTAKKAVACGWTFIYLEPTVDQASGAINFVLDFASKYQRAVVFIEDVDREQRHNDSFALGRIMTAIDGVISKNQEVIVIMTTNYADRLAAGIQRPGRIDKIINFDRFYAEDVEKLLRIVIPSEFLSSDIDWAEIVKSCAGYTPAFVNEVGVGAKLAAISEAGGVTPRVTQQMLTELASDLQVQYKACSAESVGFKR